MAHLYVIIKRNEKWLSRFGVPSVGVREGFTGLNGFAKDVDIGNIFLIHNKASCILIYETGYT